MGCSCNRRGQLRGRPSAMPPRMSTNGNKSVAKPATQSLNVQSQSQLNPASITAEKRRLQTQRRQGIIERRNKK